MFLEANISGAKRAICAVTCGTNVTLYEAQECVNKINAQAGGAIDIKFGVSINPNLDDVIVVSVIASDFENNIDFADIQTFVPPTKESLGTGIKPHVEETIRREPEPKSDVNANADGIADDLLPDFLKGE